MRAIAIAAVAIFIAGCIPYPEELLEKDGLAPVATPTQPAVGGAFPGLDPGANDLTSVHFHVHAYGAQLAQTMSDAAEAAYTRIMNDTALSSFAPHALYEIVVYGSQDEYHKKTGQPDWSAGCIVGNSIYIFSSAHTEATLAHEMTHLIWHEFMAGDLSDQQRWVNEGLAVYEESQVGNRGQELFGSLLATLRNDPIPMDQLENMVPNSEHAYEASLWYAQSEAIVRYMIEHGGRIGFGQFLTAIRNGQTFDAAVTAGYPGVWRVLNDVVSDWKRSLQ